MFDLIRNEFKDKEKLSISIEAFCVLYGIDTKDCTAEVKSFAHLYPKLEKLSSSGCYADEQDIRVRYNDMTMNESAALTKKMNTAARSI